MNRSRWQTLPLALATITTLITLGTAGAQTFPAGPVRIIVTFPPGSVTDLIARILGNKLAEQLGQPVIVDPRPGASGAIGVELAKNAPPDGHTLLLVNVSTFALLPALKPKLPYDPDKDFVALTRVASGPYVVAVHPSLGVGTVASLVKLAKGRPGQLNYGSSGNGSVPHFAGEMFSVMAGLKTVHVPYKGAVLALNDLIAGQLHFILASPTIVMPHAKTGRTRMIATTGEKRDPLLPELPTVADVVPGFEITSWQGMVVQAKTPAAVVKRLNAEIVKALQTAEVRELLSKQGSTAQSDTPAEFAGFMKAERERIARVVRQVNMTLD